MFKEPELIDLIKRMVSIYLESYPEDREQRRHHDHEPPVLGEAEGAKLAWRPQTMVEVAEADAATLFKLIDALDDDDDVQTVWGNYEVSDAVMEKLG